MNLLRSALVEPFRVGAALLRYAILNWPDTPIGLALRRRYMALRVASLGANFMLHRGCDIGGYHLIRIGDNSSIAEDVVICLGPGDNEFRMGTNSFLGPGCYIRNMNHDFDVPGAPLHPSKPSFFQGYRGGDIVIGDDVWVGARCILLPGTNIGSHSIVAAGSVVSTAIQPFSIAGGNPVRIIRKRSPGTQAALVPKDAAP